MGTTLTYRQLDRYSCQFSTFLVEIGCAPGDVVGLNMPNIPQYLIALAGTLRAGCIVSEVSPLLAPKEMIHQLNDLDARVLVTLDGIYEGKALKIKDKAIVRLPRCETQKRFYLVNFALISRFRLTPSSAAWIVKCLWTSGGIRTENLPLNFLLDKGLGIESPSTSIICMPSATTLRIPFSAASGVPASQLKLGNSAQRPKYSSSLADHITR